MTTATNSKKRNFRDAVFQEELTMQLGENGMPEYTNFGIGSNVLAISQMVRGGDPVSLADEILANGSPQEIHDLMVLVYVTRNARGGKGEKDLSFHIFLRVWNKYPMTAKKLLALYAHYGYWKDFLLINVLAKEDPSVQGLDDAVLEIMTAQLQKDISSLAAYKKAKKDKHDSGPKLSLLAKWLPREGSSFDKKISFVKRFSAAMWPELPKTEKADGWRSSAKSMYRKTVSELTSYLALPEVLLAAHREDEINFQKVASKATMVLTKTFLNEDKNGGQRSSDPKRIRMAEIFVDHMVSKGLKGGQIMPHEIVRKILSKYNISKAEELVLDAQWKDLWKNVVEQVKAKALEEGLEFNPTQMVPLSDVSGSMYGVPMEVSIALGIGISEITHEAFQNMVLTFETNPKWHRLVPTDSIVKKVRSLESAPWGGSTNFLGAYQLILDVCLKHGLSKEDMPSLIVFSDMQFNQADYDAGSDIQGKLRARVSRVASKLGWADTDPTPIVFWNLRNTGGHPVEKDSEGAVLLSGFSPSLLKLVMNGEALREEEVEIVQIDGTVKTEKLRVTPEQILRKMLDDSMYDPVREIIIASKEGALLEFGTLDKESPSLADENMEETDSDFIAV